MQIIAAIGLVLACLTAPANAVVVIEANAITDQPAVHKKAPDDPQHSPALDRDPVVIAIPALLIAIGLLSLGKPRSPRPVIA